MPEFVRVASASEVPPGEMKIVEAGDKEVVGSPRPDSLDGVAVGLVQYHGRVVPPCGPSGDKRRDDSTEKAEVIGGGQGVRRTE